MSQYSLFFLIFCNSLLAEVDIELLKEKYPKCENDNFRHECFDEVLYQNVKEIGYYRNNFLWDGQYFINDILEIVITPNKKINNFKLLEISIEIFVKKKIIFNGEATFILSLNK